MDKLSKALQKARMQREHALQLLQHPDTPKPLQTAITQIDDDHLELYHILAHRSRCKEADVFRLLRTQILSAMNQAGFRTLGITSPNYGDGKTTVALNLALSIAQDQKQTVLLVDLDLRKPSISEYLGIYSRFGIGDYYTSGVPITDILVRPSFDRFAILPAGKPLDDSSEILGSPKISALARELKTRYADRLIIYDLPPVLMQDDPLAFLPHIDALLLVVNEGITPVKDIKRALHIVSGAHVIGTVLNNAAKK